MICFSVSSVNRNAERLGQELLGAFFNQVRLNGLMENNLMQLRVQIVFDAFLTMAMDRNSLARQEPTARGKGDTIDFMIRTMGDDGVILTCKDTGGSAAYVRRTHINPHIDSADFLLTNGGLLMRAVFKWKSC